MVNLKKSSIGIGLLVFFALIGAWLIYSYINHQFIFYLFEGDTIKILETINNFQRLSWAIFVFIVFIECVFAPFPALVLYVAGGAAFGGFVAGTLALIGNTLGAAVAFFISRYFGREFMEERIPKKLLNRVDRFSKKHGALSIFLLRVNPLTSSDLFSYAAGLTKMSFKKFLFWTMVALLPAVYLQTYLGEAIEKSPIVTQISILGGALYLIGFFVAYFYARKKKRSKD